MNSRLSTKLGRGGRLPQKHGGYTYLTSGELPENRTYILKYLMAVRKGLVTDLGPTELDLTTAQIVLIDRITTKLGVIRCVEEHIRENSVMVGNDLAPSLKASYLAYNNSLRLDLQALGLDKRSEEVLTPYEILEEEKKHKRRSE